MDVVKEKNYLPQILRILGGLALLSSGIAFLIQGINSAESLSRINSFCLLMMAVLGTGVFCTKVLKETKGARSAMAAGLLLMPFYFLQIAASTYASLFGTQSSFNKLFRFYPINDPTSIAILCVATLIFAFLTWIAFASLSKQGSLKFAATFYLGNLILVLPFRGSEYTAIVGAAMLIALVILEKSFAQKEVMRTKEALFCRALIFLPFVCLIARNITLYPINDFFYAFIFGTIAVLLSTVFAKGNNDQGKTYAIGTLFGMLALIKLYNYCAKDFMLLELYEPLAPAIILAAYQYFAAFRNRQRELFHCRIAGIIFGAAVFIQLFEYSSTLVSMLMLVSSVGVIACGWIKQHTLSVRVGMMGFAFAIIANWKVALELYHMSPWLSLGISGIAIVIISSLVEKNYTSIKEKLNLYVIEIRSWEQEEVKNEAR